MEMFCPSADESVNLNLVPKNYLSLLVPEECNSREYENQADFHNIAILPLLDQLRIIMKHGEENTLFIFFPTKFEEKRINIISFK